MPFTVAHPAAVLPFRKLCPKYLNFAALVCGSIAPDLGYFIGQWNPGAIAHTAQGSIYVAIPTGAALLAAYYACRTSVADLLPQPHCLFWSTSPNNGHDILRPQSLFIAASSTIIGIWTHLCWDSFTHNHGWFVLALPALSLTILTFGKFAIPTYKLLQYASSAIGVLILLLTYNKALKITKREETTPSEFAKIARLGLMAILAIVISGPLTLASVNPQPSTTFTQRLIIQLATYSIAVFVAILAATGFAMSRINKSDASP